MSNEEADYASKYKYLLAEYDNYRKRVEKEAEIRVKNEKAKLLLKLIDIKEDLERAYNASIKAESKDHIIEGLKSIVKNMDNMLKDEGVSPIEALNKQFDPNLHEVISIIKDNTLPEYTITKEFRKGYMIDNTVIRPSLVEVSKRDENDNINIE
jgi:molecular chaperone GrpE